MTRMQKTFVILVVAVLVVGLMFVGSRKTEKTQQAPVSQNGLQIETWKTGNGARVMYVHAPQLPMVDVRIVFDAGSARDGDTPGLASLTNSMLDQGAGEWDTNALAERFDSVGASFGSSTARDMAMVQLRSLTDAALLDKAMDTLVAILQQPHFKESELQRLRKQTLIALKNQQQSPSTIASKAFFKALYGDHPYATPTIGTRESVSRLQRQDLLAFYKRYYVAENAVVAIVGDVDKAQAHQLVEKLLGKLPKGKHAEALPAATPLAQAERKLLAHPSSQTHILVGQLGMKRNDADYFTLYVGNHILGGSGFGSRIMEEIREKRGLAYSSYSYFSPMRVEGPFVMGLQTRNDKRDEALALLDQTLRKFIEEGPTAEELEHAKKNITGGFPLRIDSNRDIVDYIAMIGFYDLPLDYLNTFNQKVNAVTIEQIKDAFARRIHPDRMLTVMVGKGVEE